MAMKKRVLIAVSIIMLLCVLFCGCKITFESTDDNVGVTTATEPQKTSGTTKQTQSSSSNATQNKEEKIETISGKNARGIVKAFFEEYSTITSVDVITDRFAFVDGVGIEERDELKINGDDYYCLAKRNNGAEVMEMWCVDGMTYVNSQGQKIKAQIDIEDYLGVKLSDILTSTVPAELPDIYHAKLNRSQIYKAGYTYYFSIEISADEAYEMSGVYVGCTETYYCNSEGRIKCIITECTDGSSTKVEFNSYGKYVEITPPQDADSYIEREIDNGGNGGSENGDNGGSGEQSGEVSREAYLVYYMALEKIYGANSLRFNMFQDNNSAYVTMDVNGEDAWIYISAEAENDGFVSHYGYTEQWYIDGKAYGRRGYGTPEGPFEATEEFLYPFEDATTLAYFACPFYDEDDLAYMSMTDMTSSYLIEFGATNYNGVYEEYMYWVDKDFSEVYMNVFVYGQDGEIEEDLAYTFMDIDSLYEITLP